MRDAEIRIACVQIALSGNQQYREEPLIRAQQFLSFVQNDSDKLECLRLAMKSHGNLARVGFERLIEEAQKYLAFVRPEPSEAPKKRGRPRKN